MSTEIQQILVKKSTKPMSFHLRLTFGLSFQVGSYTMQCWLLYDSEAITQFKTLFEEVYSDQQF